LPGGHLEYGEDPLVCAERESLEETGLKVHATKIAAVTNSVFEDVGKHYITLFVLCKMDDEQAQPQVLEPEKCAGWSWKTWDDLRVFLNPSSQGDVLFLPLKSLLESRSDFGDLRL
jgi:8-oxo-dGTP diphosphatase